ncbi:DUF937 domain-containing protein [Prevotella sp. 10(H)]|uniref:DUF937 domain-containing protein n=1 Tax=Prevotella sp. 10(H) TaxID=1158294 RepID=UPI0004A76611|nr:DUF937 domain-containing protein [Prevotella sp. 10(H)]
MLDGIMDLIKGQARRAITNNADIPAEKQEAAVETTATTIVDGLKEHFTPDNLSNVLGLFGGGSSNIGNPMVSSIQNSVVSALSKKVGLNPAVANSIASAVIPALMVALSKKSNDPNDSFSFESLVQSFTGKKEGGILGSLGSLFGK